MRRAPDPPSPHRVRQPERFSPPSRVTAPIYADVWRALGNRGPPPPVYQDRYLGGPRGNVGVQTFSNRHVFLAPEIVKGLRGLALGGNRDLNALKVLVHEYAHVRQPRVNRTPIAEGGAEAFAMNRMADVLRKLRVPDQDYWKDKPQWLAYRDWVTKLAQRPDFRYIRDRGQFGRP